MSWQLSKAKPFCIPPASLKLPVFVFFKVIKDQIYKPGHLIPEIRNGGELWQKDSVWLALRLRPGFRNEERMVNEDISWKRRKDNSWTQDDPPVSWKCPSGCPLATGFFLPSALVVWEGNEQVPSFTTRLSLEELGLWATVVYGRQHQHILDPSSWYRVGLWLLSSTQSSFKFLVPVNVTSFGNCSFKLRILRQDHNVWPKTTLCQMRPRKAKGWPSH